MVASSRALPFRPLGLSLLLLLSLSLPLNQVNASHHTSPTGGVRAPGGPLSWDFWTSLLGRSRRDSKQHTEETPVTPSQPLEEPHPATSGPRDTSTDTASSETVTVGGEHGWTMISYQPLHVAVNDTLHFAYTPEVEERVGGHDVWLMPHRAAYDTCDFTGATRLGANGVLHRVQEPGEFFFACRVMEGAHCTAGHKVEVVAERGRALRVKRRRKHKNRSKKDPADVIREVVARSRNQHETWKREQALAKRNAGPRLKALVNQVVQPQQAVQVAWCGLNKDWSSRTQWASFEMYGCTQVSGIHVQQMADTSVVVIDRTDTINTVLKDPATNASVYGEELVFNTRDETYPFSEKPLNVVTNLFCSTGQLMPDGRMLSIGGSTEANTNNQLLNGSFSVRSYKGPCKTASCTFGLEQDMTSRRWYPTAQIMPDGRIMILGGSNTTGNVAINKREINNPTIEYHPRRPGEGNYYLKFLDDTVPYNLYAFVHVMPSGKVFIAAGRSYTLFNSVTNKAINGTYPDIPILSDLYPEPVMRSYPMSGTSAMFPLDPMKANNQAEIMICGGSSTRAGPLNGGSLAVSWPNRLWWADYMCYRIRPESLTPTWVPEPMCDTTACNTKYRRVMGDAVLLADGSLLIVNGAQQGFQGLTNPLTARGTYDGGFATNPQLQPLLFDTVSHTWYDVTKLPPSKVPRMYHSSAVLMHDATVLVTGSNPNTQLIWPAGKFPTEFRLEKFRPPYLNTGVARPNITASPKAITVDTLFAVYFTSPQASTVNDLTKRFTFALAFPGFSTHNQRHGMRHVGLTTVQVLRVRGTTYLAVVRSPPSLNWAPPTQYWLWLLDNKIPALESRAINVTASLRGAPARTLRINGQRVFR